MVERKGSCFKCLEAASPEDGKRTKSEFIKHCLLKELPEYSNEQAHEQYE